MLNKHILIVHHSGYIGGAGISLIDIIKSLKKIDVKVTVLCPNKPSDITNILKRFDINVINLPNIEIFAHYSGSTNFVFSYRFLNNIARIAKNYKKIINTIDSIHPDIIFLNSMTLFYLGKSLYKKGYKTICFDRETFVKGLFGFRTSYIIHCLKSYFDKVIFISNYDRIESNIPYERTMVITDKVDCNFQEEFKTKEYSDNNVKYVLFAGGMVDLKGTHIVLEAFSYLPSNIRLIFLQYNLKDYKTSLLEIRSIKSFIKALFGLDYEFRMNKLIKKYDLLNRIDFYDTDYNIGKYYSKTDLVVFPSTKAHQSRMIYESGIYKKPLIISDFKNTNEFLVDGYNGLTFKHNNPFDLSNKIIESLSNQELIDKLVKNNFELTLKNHNLEYLELEIKNLLHYVM